MIAVLGLGYSALRLWRLTEPCLWFDEIFGIHATTHAWGDLIPFVAKDLIHPPLFYLLLKLWIGIGGESVLWLRLFPVLFAIASLFPLLMLCRELKLRSTTIVVAFGLFAVNGALIKYAQEVRMYSLLLLLSLLSTWLFSRFYFRGKSFWLLVLVNVLLVYSHYFGWFVVATEVAAILLTQRIKILQTLLMFVVVAAAFVPWVFAVFRFAEPGSGVKENIGWMLRPGFRELLEFGFDLVDPFYFQQSSVDKTANFIIAIPIAAILVTALTLFVTRFRNEANKDRILFLCLFFGTPLLMAFSFSWLLPVSIWGSRHLLIVFAPAILLIAITLSDIPQKWVRRGLIAAIGVLSTAALIQQFTRPQQQQIWCAWEPLAVEWVLASQPSAETPTVYVFEDLVAYHYWFATRNLPARKIVLVKGLEGIPNDPAYFLPRGFDEIRTSSFNEVTGDEIWLSFRQLSRKQAIGEHERSTREFEVPVTYFENIGYSVEDVRRHIYGSQTAFLVRMSKRQ